MSEGERRSKLWDLIEKEAQSGLNRARLRELGVYGGAQGIWVDKDVTGHLAPDGVTVSVLHTGKHYADDLSDDALIYHYPETKRPGRDLSETNATKNARRSNLPLFVLLPLTPDGRRPVRLGWVSDWDDEAKHFLIVFNQRPVDVRDSPTEMEMPFVLQDHASPGYGRRKLRPSQQRFRFDVFKRYGLKCCVCQITIPELLVAAHICGKEHGGTDDSRNGIPLCQTHHTAFDEGMFLINPDTLALESRAFSFGSIGVTEAVLRPLRNRPHREALEWRNRLLER